MSETPYLGVYLQVKGFAICDPLWKNWPYLKLFQRSLYCHNYIWWPKKKFSYKKL